ncbi:MAG: hypothetical protein NTZ71_04820 [Planctomycetota bacterium]|nr:hypothetical protein [Planctomycetota bacterium]
MNRWIDTAMIALGTFLACIGLATLAVSGVIWLNSIGIGSWLGWVNLVVFCGGWYLAWRWTRPGATIPAPDWTVPAHFLPRDRETWNRLRELAQHPPEALLDGVPAGPAMVAAFQKEWELLEAPYRADGKPAWSAHTVAEWTTALRAILERLARRSHLLLGPMLNLRIDRWLLAWHAGILAGRYGSVAWLPGLILAPVDTAIRFVAGIVLRRPAEQGVKREATRSLWSLFVRDMGVVLIDLLAGRLTGPADRYASLVEPMAPITGKIRLWRPIVLGLTQSIPLIVVFVSGMVHLLQVGIWAVVISVLILLIGLVLFVVGCSRWLLPPVAIKDGREQAKHCVETILAREERALAGIANLEELLQFVFKLDCAVSEAMTGSPAGWKSRSALELVGACRDLTDRLEDLVRRALPGSRHICLSDWMAAGGWLGWLGRVSEGGTQLVSAFRGGGGLTGLALAWAGGVIKRQADSTLREALSRATGRMLADVLLDLHSGRWQVEFLVRAKTDVIQPVLMVVGQSGSGVSKIVEELKQFSQLEGWEIRESSSLWTPGHSESGIDAVSSLIARADVLILASRAVSAARDADIQLIDRLYAKLGEARVRPAVLGVLTAIDLVPPAMEWTPPYGASDGGGRKALGIQACLESARQSLGDRVDEWIPAGVRNGVKWGYSEGIVPWIAARVDHAHGVRVARELAEERIGSGWMEMPLQATHGARRAWSFFLRGWKKPGQSS